MLRSSIIGLLGALALTEPVSAAPKTTTPGSTVGELIALARQLSPELAAAALNAEAAVARITSAGALPDPTGRITTNVRDRYSQGSAAQDDVLRLEIEAEELNIEIERLRGQTIKTAAQLNALLNRRPDAPLARPAALRPLPNESKMRVAALVDRAVRRNPSIAEGEAKAGSASAMRELAERNRYPDITLGVMTTQDRPG